MKLSGPLYRETYVLAHARFTHEYQKSAVQGASPIQLIVMMYDGALRFMEAGRHAMQQKDLEKQNANLQKAQRVVVELMACLDMKNGGEVAKNLFALYSYVVDELVQANMSDDLKAVERSIKVISDLRESWSELQKSVRQSKDDTIEQLAA